MQLAPPLAVSVALALGSSLPCAQGKVWVVDAFGLGDFTTIQPAIDAAAPGDTVLVRQGDYPAFALAKELTVSAVQDAEVGVDQITIAGIQSGEHAVVRGFMHDETVTVSANAGVVVLAELERTLVHVETPALRILDSDAVVLTRSDLWGGQGTGEKPPGAGLELTRSTLYVHGSVIRAGDGHGAFPLGKGGPGAILDDAFLYLADSTIRGGQGYFGYGEFPTCIDGQDGGPGIVFAGTPSAVHLLDAALEGGTAGSSGFGCGSSGHPGPTTTGTGTLTVLPGAALALQTPRTVPPGTDVELALSGGPAGAPAFLGLGSQPFAVFLPPFLGALLIDGPYDVVALGALDPAGELAATIPAGSLEPGEEARQLHMQAGYLTPSLGIVLGAPSEVIVTDVLPAQKTVWIVDASGGGDFTSLQAAVAAVPIDSTLLLRAPGTGEVLNNMNKPLTIAADAGPPVYVSWVHVRDIPAGKRVVLRGLLMNGAEVSDCDGNVWLEDLELLTNIFSLHEPLTVEQSADVVLVDCTSIAGSLLGTDGLLASDSDIYAYGCWFEGGRGNKGMIFSGGDIQPAATGGAGVHLLGGVRLVASGVSMIGASGGGGVSDGSQCVPPADGGAGLHLETASSEVWLLDSPATGGPGGIDASGGICTGQTGSPGAPVLDETTGSLIAALAPDEALSMTTTSPVREGEMTHVQLSGPSGAPVFLGLGDGIAELFLPALAGAVCIAPPYTVLTLGVLDASGTLLMQLPMPPLGGPDYKHVIGQAGYINPSGAVLLGSPSDVLLVSSSF